MRFVSPMKKFIPRPLKSIFAAYRIRKNSYYKRIRDLPINRSGLSEDGIPFVELNNGRIFFGYPPTSIQRYYHKYFLDRNIKVRLEEECINVAYDIVLRYIGPESKEKYISQGKFYDFRPGNIVIEVGAYMGYYAIRAAELVGETGVIVAVEAIDENFQLLKRNVEANSLKNILVIPKAAWNSSGTLKFYRHSRQQASAISDVVSIQEEFTVSCDTVDHILEDLAISCVDFVRIQVNGAEQEVLDGMQKTLEQYPTLLIAAIYERNGKVSWMNVKSFLESKGYTTRVKQGNIFANKPS